MGMGIGVFGWELGFEEGRSRGDSTSRPPLILIMEAPLGSRETTKFALKSIIMLISNFENISSI